MQSIQAPAKDFFKVEYRLHPTLYLMGISVTAGSATAAMANAAFTSLVTQAGTTLVNNKGDINKTLKDLGKS